MKRTLLQETKLNSTLEVIESAVLAKAQKKRLTRIFIRSANYRNDTD